MDSNDAAQSQYKTAEFVKILTIITLVGSQLCLCPPALPLPLSFGLNSSATVPSFSDRRFRLMSLAVSSSRRR